MSCSSVFCLWAQGLASLTQLWQRMAQLWQRLAQLWQHLARSWQRLAQLGQRPAQLRQRLAQPLQLLARLQQGLAQPWEVRLSAKGRKSGKGLSPRASWVLPFRPVPKKSSRD